MSSGNFARALPHFTVGKLFVIPKIHVITAIDYIFGGEHALKLSEKDVHKHLELTQSSFSTFHLPVNQLSQDSYPTFFNSKYRLFRYQFVIKFRMYKDCSLKYPLFS